VIDQVRTGEEQEDRKATPDNESWKGRKEKKKKIKSPDPGRSEMERNLRHDLMGQVHTLPPLWTCPF
jgi:hypothetical protein